MAKSIRSKVKRKARAEFRRTIGTEAYNKNMSKIQEKLKECVEGQSLKSLEHLSAQLATDTMETEEDVMKVNVEAGVAPANPMDFKGENKAPVAKKRSKRKAKLRSAEKKKVEKMVTDKPKPRFFCQF